MLFTSYGFIAFLVMVLVLYYLVPKKWQWPMLLVASYVFYYIANPMYLLFILVTTMSAYIVSIQMDRINRQTTQYLQEHHAELGKEEKKAYKNKMKAGKWIWLLFGLFINIGILSVTKYTNFVIDNINGLFAGEGPIPMVDMIVPMGISFYTFQTVGYIIDVYRGKQEPERNPFKLALFVSFFPQLVQGPISRFEELATSLFAEHPFHGKTVSFGLMRILWGYFKKLVLADRMLPAVLVLVRKPEEYTGAYVLVAMLLYAYELYCDFTGGIDITIGIAETMGIHMPENFRQPYFSKNIREYWKRWHITMGAWFTDYLFYPLSVCGPMRRLTKWSREHLGEVIGKRVPVYLSAFFVWLATGIWHGAAWNFVVWGLMNFLVIIISQELEPVYARFHKALPVKGNVIYEGFQIVRTILLMSAIRMFDCYRNVPLTFAMLGSMCVAWDGAVLTDGSLLRLGLSVADYILLAVGLVLLLAVSLYQVRVGKVREALYHKPPVVYYGVMAMLFVAIILFGAYGIGYDPSQFIYNQF